VEFHQRRKMMKKLVFALTLMAFTMCAAVVVARDQNHEGLRQAWAAIEAQQNKEAAAEKAAAEKAKASSSQTKSKNDR
jgi:hypothetical protein